MGERKPKISSKVKQGREELEHNTCTIYHTCYVFEKSHANNSNIDESEALQKASCQEFN